MQVYWQSAVDITGFSDDFPDQCAGKGKQENEWNQYYNKTLGKVFCRIPYHPLQVIVFLHSG